ncbi:hypothetical protein E2C01_084421 [Portunus trituberculatus]|uniref:Uncharacterized protein n=1 Tax=Portunus trituberculatus TaxID=210409 RepID=A0A5B7IY80_PORTR|nr:hypothetical protein [Portunus trituberculatus]
MSLLLFLSVVHRLSSPQQSPTPTITKHYTRINEDRPISSLLNLDSLTPPGKFVCTSRQHDFYNRPPPLLQPRPRPSPSPSPSSCWACQSLTSPLLTKRLHIHAG